MILATLLAAIGRRSGLGFLWRLTALGLAASALVLAWLVRPRDGRGADALLSAALTAVAALLAASALAGGRNRLMTSPAPSRFSSAPPAGALHAA